MKPNPLIKLNPEQLQSILDQMDKTDWWNIGSNVLTQLVAVGIAAYSGFYFQKRFRKEEERKSKINEVYRFNEAVIYLSSFLENSASLIDQIVLGNLSLERKACEYVDHVAAEAAKGKAIPQTHTGSFGSIRPLEIAQEESFLSRIPDLGKQPEMVQAFHRLRAETLQFSSISDERLFLIKKFLDERGQPEPIELSKIKFGEIFARTNMLVVSAEGILDAAIYLEEFLTKIAQALIDGLRKDKIRGIKIHTLKPNEYTREVLGKLNDIVDTFPQYNKRHLHMPRRSTKDQG